MLVVLLFRKRFPVLACALTLFSVSFSALTKSAPQQLILGHIGAEGSMFDLTASEFARRVNAKLAGRYEVTVKGASILGNDAAMLELVNRGEIAFSLPYSPLVKTMPPFAAFDLPYLILTRNHVREIRDRLLNEYLRPEARRRGLDVVAMWDNGFRHITTNARPIETPRDLAGLTIRIATGSWKSQVFQLFGSRPKEIPFDKVYAALKTNEADAQESPLSAISSRRYYEVQKYLSMTGHSYQPVFLVCSSEHFSHLDPEGRKIISEIAEEMQDWSLDEGEKQEARLLAELRNKMTVNEPDKFALLLASIAIYQAYARDYPGGGQIVKLLYDPAALELLPQHR